MLRSKSVVGRIVSHYRIVSHLGGGGMGVVFQAEDVRLGREVALKFLPDHLASDPVALERFRREARAASSINHPYICTVHDIGEDNGQPFLVMELLRGETLKHRLGRGRVALTELLEWSSQISDALDVAHNSAIIHRDVKPANLFITTRGEAKVLDFGLARTVTSRQASPHSHDANAETMVDFETSPGLAVGTVAYMSPEQARGEELDRRTDIFSLGIVLYEMATGEAPFTGNTSAVIFDAILNREPRPVLDINPASPAELGRIIGKALEKDRRMRYQSAAELYTDLQRLKRDSSMDQAAARMPPVPTTVLRSSGWLVLVSSALLLLAIVGAAFLFRWRQEVPIRELVPTRVTSNNTDLAIQTQALSPDGKVLAYSDSEGVHVRSVQTGDSRLLPGTKGKSVQYWAADGAQFFLTKLLNDEYLNYGVSLAGGNPRLLGKSVSSPAGRYSVIASSSHTEVRNVPGGKSYQLDRKGAYIQSTAWSPHDERLAVAFLMATESGYSIELLNPENGRWTVLIPLEREDISGVAWLSRGELMYAKREPPPRSDTNLWTIKIDPATGLASGAPQRRTRWTDFKISDLSGDVNRLSFIRNRVTSDIYIGDLQARGSRLAALRQLTRDDASAQPISWTPDSRTLLLQSDRDGLRQVYRQDIDKDFAERVTSGPGDHFGPRISPDGQWIVYVRRDNGLSHLPMQLMRMPIAGGDAQEILTEQGYNGFSCSHIPKGDCVLSEIRPGSEVISRFNPLTGRGPTIIEITGEITGAPAISPDGQHIAFLVPGTPRNKIRLINLHGVTEGEITVSGAQSLSSLDRSVDGTTFFCGDEEPGETRLLHVKPDGTSQVLWKQPADAFVWGIQSPDGRHLATFKSIANANVWMVEQP